MQPSSVAPLEFAVGDALRFRIGRAVLGSMLVAVVYFGFTWTTKELHMLYVHEPWQDDPYDAVVSFSLWCVPLLTAACALRVALCRRSAALPVRRAYDLLRASRTLVAIVVIALTSDWASVVLRAHRGAWTSTTQALVGVLALITALTVVVARQLRRAGRDPVRADSPCQPDWLADAFTLGERGARRLGPRSDDALSALRWLDRTAAARIRRHPLRAGAVSALALGVAVAAPQLIVEAYGLNLALFVVGATACGVFAFVVIVGWHLRVIGARSAAPASAACALVLACASVPLTVAFRGSLWWILATDRDTDLGRLTALVLVVAIATGALVIATLPVVRRIVRA